MDLSLPTSYSFTEKHFLLHIVPALFPSEDPLVGGKGRKGQNVNVFSGNHQSLMRVDVGS
jgi:hypothetical protein